MSVYIVKSPLDHDRKHYPAGSDISVIPDDVAAPLVAEGVLQLKPEVTAQPEEAPAATPPVAPLIGDEPVPPAAPEAPAAKK